MLKKVTERSFLSPVVAYTFIPVALSGVLLLFHLRVPGMKDIHEWVGLAFTIFCVFHIAVNWKPLVKYLPQRQARRALVLTLVLTLLCGALGVFKGDNGPRRQAEIPMASGQIQ